MIDEANRYNPGLFRTSYLNLADGYQDLIDDAEEKIDENKREQSVIVVTAAIQLIVAIGLMGAGGHLIKKNSGGTE